MDFIVSQSTTSRGQGRARDLFVSILTFVLILAFTAQDSEARSSRRPMRGVAFVQAGKKPHPYYGQDFFQRVQAGERDEQLIEDLHQILISKHVIQSGSYDRLAPECGGGATCYWHRPLSYDKAREILLGMLYLEGDRGNYAIRDVYCEHDYGRNDFPKQPYPGPNTVPSSTVVNTEHTWPQSRFSERFDKSTQKSDLHHLFPTDSEMNQLRGNHKFAEVDKNTMPLPCSTAKLGMVSGETEMFFEPPQAHKGDVARALFYFSVRYKISIDDDEEKFLRKWNEQDPVDEFEARKNDAIMKAQGNRNPFVDFPQLPTRIKNF